MKSFQVVIVTILFMALLITSDASKCKKELEKVKQQLDQCEAELENVEELNNQLQNETAELKKELAECEEFFEECHNYQTLSTEDRKNTYKSELTVGGEIGCDDNLGPAWFRFQGAAGTQMATSCVEQKSCGTHATGWLNGAHPTVDEGKVTRKACFNYFSDCCKWSIDVEVRNCGDYYVYYINKTPPEHPCNLRYCGSD